MFGENQVKLMRYGCGCQNESDFGVFCKQGLSQAGRPKVINYTCMVSDMNERASTVNHSMCKQNDLLSIRYNRTLYFTDRTS